jgi:hypothetical protein
VDGGVTFTAVAGCQASHALGFGAAAPVRGGASGRRPVHAGYPATFQTGRVAATFDGVAVLRSDDVGTTWVRINDDSHQWGWTGEVITGAPASTAVSTWAPTAAASSTQTLNEERELHAVPARRSP